MTDQQPLHALYLVHRRGEHKYREWIVMPGTDVLPVQVWSRYIDHEGARPVWRGSRRGPTADDTARNLHTSAVLNNILVTVNGHYRQNERLPENKWEWDAPIVIQTSPQECSEYVFKVPYPVINRVKRVQGKRAKSTGGGPDATATLAQLARVLSDMTNS